MREGSPVIISPEVYAGLEFVRSSGQVNMFAAKEVARIAAKAGYSQTSEWIKRNKGKYAEGILYGFEYTGQ